MLEVIILCALIVKFGGMNNMDNSKISQLFNFLNGGNINVKCNNIPSHLYFKNHSFICESLEDKYINCNRQHVDIKIEYNNTQYYGIAALNLRYPRSLYKFDILSTSDLSLKFDNAILLINNTNDAVKYLNNFAIENFKYYEYENLTITSKLVNINRDRYVKFSTNIKLSNEYLLGIILRIAHSLCFLFSKFCASSIALLFSDCDYVLTSSGKFNLNRSYTIFDKPHNYDYINAYEYSPQLTSKFIQRFIKLALEHNYFYNIICMTLENASYNAYSDPINSFVGLEIFAQKNSTLKKIPNEWNRIIKKFYPKFIDFIKQNISDEDIQNFLCKKVNTFFNPLNSDRLKEASIAVNYPLNEDDQNILKCRNKFLHGNYNYDILNPMEIFKEVLRPHRLLCSLLAKKAGYEGYIFQYDKFIPTCQTNIPITDVFRKI